MFLTPALGAPRRLHSRRNVRSILFVATLAALVSTTALADKTPFGPWDSGTKREVVRKGKKGIARAKHPVVGDVSKVPSARPKPPLRNDPDVPETQLLNINVVEGSMSSNPLFLAALVYRHFLTKVDGPKCQHLPTCSRFASQAVARNGPVGIMMGLDRVIRPPESSAVRTLPEVEGWGGVRHLDPVENYEFWREEEFTGFPPPADEQPLAMDPNKSEARVPMAPFEPQVDSSINAGQPPVAHQSPAVAGQTTDDQPSAGQTQNDQISNDIVSTRSGS